MTKKVYTNRNFNPGGAKWCEEHHRLECTKNRTHGRGPCHQLATRGTDACRNHSGMRQSVVKAQGEARITAFQPFGAGATVDAGAAVMSVLQMTYLRVGMYSEMLRRQIAAQGDETDQGAEMSASGLIGHRYGMGGKDGIQYIQTEEIRALVLLEQGERDRVVRYAKTAHDMGISERITSLAEEWGDRVAARIATMLAALGLTEEQAAMVPALMEAHLGSLEIEGTVVLDGDGQ